MGLLVPMYLDFPFRVCVCMKCKSLAQKCTLDYFWISEYSLSYIFKLVLCNVTKERVTFIEGKGHNGPCIIIRSKGRLGTLKTLGK